jgi:hypothetical protein
MSKRFKDKTCAYCGGTSDSGDHIVARNFFPERLRADLPQVPACQFCNNEKSKIEHYLATVLPVGSTHPVAEEIAHGTLSKRLDKNTRLRIELADGVTQLNYLSDEANFATSFRPDIIEKYAALMARGLLFHHFQVSLDEAHQARGSVFRQDAIHAIDKIFNDVHSHVKLVTGNHAGNAFWYRGFSVVSEDPQASMWHMRLYGGIKFGSSENGMNGPFLCDFWAITCLREQSHTGISG